MTFIAIGKDKEKSIQVGRDQWLYTKRTAGSYTLAMTPFNSLCHLYEVGAGVLLPVLCNASDE